MSSSPHLTSDYSTMVTESKYPNVNVDVTPSLPTHGCHLVDTSTHGRPFPLLHRATPCHVRHPDHVPGRCVKQNLEPWLSVTGELLLRDSEKSGIHVDGTCREIVALCVIDLLGVFRVVRLVDDRLVIFSMAYVLFWNILRTICLKMPLMRKIWPHCLKIPALGVRSENREHTLSLFATRNRSSTVHINSHCTQSKRL